MLRNLGSIKSLTALTHHRQTATALASEIGLGPGVITELLNPNGRGINYPMTLDRFWLYLHAFFNYMHGRPVS